MTAPLTIGIDARAAAEVPAGRGRLVRELLRALAARADDGTRYVLYARDPWREPWLDERFRWSEIAARDPGWHVRAARRANGECEVFLSTNSYLTAWFLRIPCALVVHDLIAFDRAMRPNRRSRAIEQLTLGPAVRRAAALIVTTRVTAELLAARYPRAAARIGVAPLGPASAPMEPLREAERAALPAAGFVLAVGTLEPRKNLPRLIAAHGQLPEELRRRHPLVVVGALGWEASETLAALDALGEEAVRLGHVSEAALAELYGRCAVFCYPSLGEGFGLPVLEAMAAGAAVLTSNVSSLPEVGGEAVAYADPRDVRSIARELGRLLEDPGLRADLGRRAVARAATFSWERFADEVLGALAACASGARGAMASATRDAERLTRT